MSAFHARVTKKDTPPAWGYLTERNPITSAIGMARTLINTHARIDAGPARSAVRPGSRRIPDPRTDPIYKGIICHSDRQAVLGIDGCTVSQIMRRVYATYD
jgi:hypothetical protein